MVEEREQVWAWAMEMRASRVSVRAMAVCFFINKYSRRR